jgi:hypothetical protein
MAQIGTLLMTKLLKQEIHQLKELITNENAKKGLE